MRKREEILANLSFCGTVQDEVLGSKLCLLHTVKSQSRVGPAPHPGLKLLAPWRPGAASAPGVPFPFLACCAAPAGAPMGTTTGPHAARLPAGGQAAGHRGSGSLLPSHQCAWVT